MNKLKIGMINLGCDKNRIDTEIMLSSLKDNFEIVNDPKISDIIVVNTCGFIEASKQESIDTILEMAKYKEKNNCKILIATGCLTQRYGKELTELMPEIDIMLGVNNYDKLNESIISFLNNSKKVILCDKENSKVNQGERILTTGKSCAYVRIAEGCNNNCTYCIIPQIRGRYRSRKMEDIIEEVKSLAKNGVKEIILIAQDTTKYGIDIYGEKKLPELLRKLSIINELDWIRILYCYPEDITEELINEIAVNDKICKYLDIPIQHISNNILKAMRRKSTKELINSNIQKLRERISNICLRTSIIVGFPGETEEDFQELKDFVKDIKFDKLGVFKYSQEEGTPAANMEKQIDEEVKEKRENELMIIQQEISKEKNLKKIGKTYKVLVEEYDDMMWYGRSYEMAPEIDGQILFSSEQNIEIGSIVEVKITSALEYDLIGVV